MDRDWCSKCRKRKLMGKENKVSFVAVAEAHDLGALIHKSASVSVGSLIGPWAHISILEPRNLSHEF